MFDNSFDILTVVTNVLKELENMSEILNNIEERLEIIDSEKTNPGIFLIRCQLG
jgi:hypothetical protein